MLELQKIGGPLGAAVHTISITLNTRTPAAQKVVAIPRPSAAARSVGRLLLVLVILWELAFFCSQLRCLSCWPKMPDSVVAGFERGLA